MIIQVFFCRSVDLNGARFHEKTPTHDFDGIVVQVLETRLGAFLSLDFGSIAFFTGFVAQDPGSDYTIDSEDLPRVLRYFFATPDEETLANAKSVVLETVRLYGPVSPFSYLVC